MPLRSTPESDGNLYGAVTSSAHPTERRQSSGRMKRGFATKTDRFIGFPHTEQPTRRRVLRRIAGRAPATKTIFTEQSSGTAGDKTTTSDTGNRPAEPIDTLWLQVAAVACQRNGFRPSDDSDSPGAAHRKPAEEKTKRCRKRNLHFIW